MHQSVTPSALAGLQNLDQLDPLEALELVAHLRRWTMVAAEQQMLRARAVHHSWREIAEASGVNKSTTRRWVVAGLPDQTRRRQ